MRKFNLWFSLIALLVVGIGVYLSPWQGVFWLASPDLSAQVVRGVLAFLVIVQLITEPPRHLIIRTLTGIASIGTAFWALHTATFMSTPIFDSLLFLQTAVALGITALELPSNEHDFITEKNVLAK